MSIFNCIIVDDEPLGRQILREYLDDIPTWSLVHEFSSAIGVEQKIAQSQIDAILLDIQMPKLSGIEFLRNLSNPPLVIFTTAYADYAVDAFELEAFDYLVKPISFERFYRSLQRAEKSLNRTEAGNRWLKIKEGKRLYKVSTGEIIAAQAFGDYVRVHTEAKVYITKAKLNNFMSMLGDDFCQVHRSWVVNLHHAQFLEGNQLTCDQLKVPVSATYREDLLNRL